MNPFYIIIPVVLIGLAALLFFRTAPGEKLVDNLRPKPNLGDPASWTIGPIVNGENASLNMPLHPDGREQPGPGFVINMPHPENQPHYITTDYGALTGKTRVTIRGHIEGGPVLFKDGVSSATMCLYFQRQFDDWRAIQSDPPQLSDTETFRWYATGSALLSLAQGSFTLTASFSDKWTAVQYSDSISKPEAFKAAMATAGEVGFVLGGFAPDGSGGWGHGVTALTPAKIVVAEFRID